MTNLSLTCNVCGCALSQSDVMCPLCGAAASDQGIQNAALVPVAGRSTRVSAPNEQCGFASNGALSSFSRSADAYRRKAIIVALVVMGVVAVLGAAFFAYSAWQHTQSISQQPDVAQSNKKKRVQVDTHVAPPTHSGSTAGALAGGGIAASQANGLFLSSSEGIYYQNDHPTNDESALESVASGQVSCLNWRNDTLYYLSAAKKTTESGTGIAVCKLEKSTEATYAASQEQMLYQAQGDSKISCLSLWDDTLYFVETSGGACSLKELPLVDASTPRVLETRTADEAWLFIEDETLYFVTTSATDWTVLSKKLNDISAAFKTAMQGTGSLKTACFTNGILYYSIKEAQGASCLSQKSIQGEFKDYPETSDVVRISAVEEVIAVVTQQGSLQWVNNYSQYVYDVTWVLDEGLSGANPQKLALSTCGEWLYIRDDKGRIVQFNVNTDEAWCYEEDAQGASSSVSNLLPVSLSATKVVS